MPCVSVHVWECGVSVCRRVGDVVSERATWQGTSVPEEDGAPMPKGHRRVLSHVVQGNGRAGVLWRLDDDRYHDDCQHDEHDGGLGLLH
jgi:hypothetical protein